MNDVLFCLFSFFVCFCRMDPDVCFLVWHGVSLAKHPVVWLLCIFALCQTYTILPVVGSQFLEGVESRLRRSRTAQMMALSSLSQISDCCSQDSHLLPCMVVVAFLLLFGSTMKPCESFWPILLPPDNSLFSILWPNQANSLPCRVCLTMLAHMVCFQFSFCKSVSYISTPKLKWQKPIK